MKLFEVAPQGELLITKITRPISFWVVLVTFIILLFLNSFNLIHTDSLYLEILKSVLMTMTGFYFTARAFEKIAAYKYQNNTSNTNPSNVNINNVNNTNSNTINPDKLNFD